MESDLMGVLKGGWPFYWGQGASLCMQAVLGRGHDLEQDRALPLSATPRVGRQLKAFS